MNARDADSLQETFWSFMQNETTFAVKLYVPGLQRKTSHTPALLMYGTGNCMRRREPRLPSIERAQGRDIPFAIQLHLF